MAGRAQPDSRDARPRSRAGAAAALAAGVLVTSALAVERSGDAGDARALRDIATELTALEEAMSVACRAVAADAQLDCYRARNRAGATRARTGWLRLLLDAAMAAPTPAEAALRVELREHAAFALGELDTDLAAFDPDGRDRNPHEAALRALQEELRTTAARLARVPQRTGVTR